MQMKTLVIGSAGQLGSDIANTCKNSSCEVIALTHRDIEVENMESVRWVLNRHHPDIVINTAAYHHVDHCESNQDQAWRVNVIGSKNVSIAANEIHAKLVYISTDYVFDGSKGSPYTEFDQPNPLNVYGRTKWWGEKMAADFHDRFLIIRVSSLFGKRGSKIKGGNFVLSILEAAKRGKPLQVVNDQFSSPTYTVDAAKRIIELTMTNQYGIYHVTNSGMCSWYDFAKEIITAAGLDVTIDPISCRDYKRPAARPVYSVLRNYHAELLGLPPLPDWKNALHRYIKEAADE